MKRFRTVTVDSRDCSFPLCPNDHDVEHDLALVLGDQKEA